MDPTRCISTCLLTNLFVKCWEYDLHYDIAFFTRTQQIRSCFNLCSCLRRTPVPFWASSRFNWGSLSCVWLSLMGLTATWSDYLCFKCNFLTSHKYLRKVGAQERQDKELLLRQSATHGDNHARTHTHTSFCAKCDESKSCSDSPHVP